MACTSFPLTISLCTDVVQIALCDEQSGDSSNEWKGLSIERLLVLGLLRLGCLVSYLANARPEDGKDSSVFLRQVRHGCTITHHRFLESLRAIGSRGQHSSDTRG